MQDFYGLTNRGRARRLRKVALAALAAYDLDVRRLRLLSNSYNCTFRVDTPGGGKYVLRVCLPASHSEIQIRSEMIWLDALRRDRELWVPKPLATREGGFFTTVEVVGVPKPRHCVIFSWVPGRNLDAQLTVINAERFGAFAARLHQHAAGFEPLENFSASFSFDQVFPFDEPVILFDDEHRGVLPPARSFS